MSTPKLPHSLNANSIVPSTDLFLRESDQQKQELSGSLREPSSGEEKNFTARFGTPKPTRRNKDSIFDNAPISATKIDSPQTVSLTPASSEEDLPSTITSAAKLKLHNELTSDQQYQLKGENNIVMKDAPTDPKSLSPDFIKSRGMFATSLLPTFSAYKLVDASPTKVTDAFWNPTNAHAFIPGCAEIEGSAWEEMSQTIKYTLRGKSVIGTFEDKIELRSERNQLPEGEMITFEQQGKSEYLRLLKGELQAMPYQGKTLVCLKVFADLKGKVLPRMVTNQMMKDGIQDVFQDFLNLEELQ